MKNVLLTVVLFLAASVNVTAQNPQDSKSEGFNGMVHKVQTTVYKAVNKNGRIVKSGKPDFSNEVKYLPEENIRVYYRDGKLDSLVNKLYHERQKFDVYTSVYFYENEKLSQDDIYINGKIFMSTKHVYGDKEIDKIVTDYDQYGKKNIRKIYKWESSFVQSDMKYRKYSDGSVKEYDPSDEDIYTIRDAKGRLIKQSDMFDDCESECMYVEVNEYTYNEQGRLTTLMYSVKNCNTSKITKHKVTYNYPSIDAQGNWLYMEVRVDGRPYGIVEREISYYE